MPDLRAAEPAPAAVGRRGRRLTVVWAFLAPLALTLAIELPVAAASASATGGRSSPWPASASSPTRPLTWTAGRCSSAGGLVGESAAGALAFLVPAEIVVVLVEWRLLVWRSGELAAAPAGQRGDERGVGADRDPRVLGGLTGHGAPGARGHGALGPRAATPVAPAAPPALRHRRADDALPGSGPRQPGVRLRHRAVGIPRPPHGGDSAGSAFSARRATPSSGTLDPLDQATDQPGAGMEIACDIQPSPTCPTVDPPSPNSASREMMVARCCDGMRAFLSQPCLTGMAMPKAMVETRYRGTATQKSWISAAPITVTVVTPAHTMRMRPRSARSA